MKQYIPGFFYGSKHQNSKQLLGEAYIQHDLMYYSPFQRSMKQRGRNFQCAFFQTLCVAVFDVLQKFNTGIRVLIHSCKNGLLTPPPGQVLRVDKGLRAQPLLSRVLSSYLDLGTPFWEFPAGDGFGFFLLKKKELLSGPAKQQLLLSNGNEALHKHSFPDSPFFHPQFYQGRKCLLKQLPTTICKPVSGKLQTKKIHTKKKNSNEIKQFIQRHQK